MMSITVRKLGHEAKGFCRSCWYSNSPGIMFLTMKFSPVPSDKGENFIVKNMIPGEFEYQQDLQKPLASCPNLRTVIDIIPDFELFVYHFLAVDLLQISQRPLSKETR